MNDAALETLWKHVLDRWDDEAAHRAFLEHCRLSDRLVEAAVRYRGMKGDHTRGALAEKKLAAIAALALTRLEAERSPARAKQSELRRLRAHCALRRGDRRPLGLSRRATLIRRNAERFRDVLDGK